MAKVPDLTLEAGLPASVSAEKTILGAILLDSVAFTQAAEKLTADDFSLDSHRRIFLRMADLMESRRAVDIVTLANELHRHKEIEAVGGVSYLASLTEGIPRRPVISDYIAIVKDKSVLRRLMSICSNTIARAADQSDTALQIMDEHTSQVENALAASMTSGLQRASEYLQSEFGTPDKMIEVSARAQGLETGFQKFDAMTCGLQRKELIIIGARPSQGKTSLMLNIAEHVGILCEGYVAINSLEMSTESLLRRFLCSLGRIPFQAHKSGSMNDRMTEDFHRAWDDSIRAHIFIDDKPKTAMRTVAQWRALKARGQLDLAMVDFLTLFQHDDEMVKRKSGYQIVGQDALILKNAAKELNIPVVVLCQLSRDVAKRQDKRPALSDLRESGMIEEFADLVAFIHREGYYEPKDENLKNKAELIIAKQRNGPVGIIDLEWTAEYMRFQDPIKASDLEMQTYLTW